METPTDTTSSMIHNIISSPIIPNNTPIVGSHVKPFTGDNGSELLSYDQKLTVAYGVGGAMGLLIIGSIIAYFVIKKNKKNS